MNNNFYLFIFLIIFSNTAAAQITIETNTLLQVDDELHYRTITTTDVDYQSNTPNNQWDFSPLINGTLSNDTILPAASGPAFDQFPTSTLRLPFLGMEAYGTQIDDQIILLGISGQTFIPTTDTILTFPFTNPYVYQSRPLNYDDSSNQTTQFSTRLATSDLPGLGDLIDTIEIPNLGEVIIDSIEIIGQLLSESQVSSYGSVLLSGQHIDVLKEHSSDSLSFTFMARGTYYIGAFPITLWIDVTDFLPESFLDISRRGFDTDRFISLDYKESVAEFSFDRQLPNNITVRYKSDLLVTNVKETDHHTELNAFPNPTPGLFRINTEDYNQLIVRNSLGKRMTHKIIEKKLLDISHFPNGIYFIDIMHSNKRKVIKIEKI